MTRRTHEGRYDPLATFACLRRRGVLGACSYLAVTNGVVEIGWGPQARLSYLAGTPCEHWRSALADLADRAERLQQPAIGYIGFDAVDSHEGRLPDGSGAQRPLIEFMIAGQSLTFQGDRVAHRAATPFDVKPFLRSEPEDVWAPCAPERIALLSETPKRVFVDAVEKAIALIKAGHLEKVVLSRYQAYEAEFDALALFARLAHQRTDAFLLCFDDLTAVVPSPELLLNAQDRRLITNPLAGTRPRAEDPRRDDLLGEELRHAHKDIVEHVVSVTAMWAELEPVCEPDSLVVARLMDVIRLPNVQHLSSLIRGTLARERHVLDALWRLFPAVTVTGLPKAEAVRTLRQLEPHPRFLYAGAIGSLRGRENCRFFLAIRGLFRTGTRAFIQAGAGILAESVPEAEWLETSHKLAAMQHALVADGHPRWPAAEQRQAHGEVCR
jgi:salicylate synthase